MNNHVNLFRFIEEARAVFVARLLRDNGFVVVWQRAHPNDVYTDFGQYTGRKAKELIKANPGTSDDFYLQDDILFSPDDLK